MSGPTVVLVHGGFVDGSGWRGVYDDLRGGGLDVRVVQNPTISLADDARVTRAVLDDVDRPVVLVGHSYGGAVITEAGTHPAVAALVYVTAFAPDTGESVQSLIGTFPTDGPQPPILPPANGFLLLDRTRFAGSFAGDLPSEDAGFLGDAQVPWGVDAFAGTVTEAAWHSKPAWYLHVTEDRMIPPVAQLTMAERTGATVATTPGSHAIYLSRPKAVAELVRAAVEAVS